LPGICPIVPFGVDLGDQRAGCVDDRKLALLGQRLDPLGHPMRAEHRHRSGRYLVQLVDEDRAPFAQVFDHMPVVHDLMADVDGRAELGQRTLDNLDRAFDACAETPGLGQHDLNHPTPPNIQH
jgi:hypothetical protein